MLALTFSVLCLVTSARSSYLSDVIAGLSAEVVTSYYQCHYQANLIRAALRFHIPVPNVPQNEISDKDVSFLLFTRYYSNYPLRISVNETSIRMSPFQPNKRVVLFVDGYSVPSSAAVRMIPPAILPADDINIVITNWDSYNNYDLQYSRNVTVPRLGSVIVARFIQQLIAVGADPKKMYLIGFSAGGEVVGLAAKQIRPKIGKLLALDPEGSCFNFLSSADRVDKTDADFVSIAHCSVGMRALPLTILGDVTFYINGGVVQIPCLTQGSLYNINTCSHGFCRQYFIDSLSKNKMSVGLRCNSYLDYQLKRCNCRDTVPFGYYTPNTTRGLYFVDTNTYDSSKNNAFCSGSKTFIMDKTNGS